MIFLTSSRAEPDRVRADHFGVNANIVKPIECDPLVDAQKNPAFVGDPE
ncbi:MAG: hypothetical protein AB1813_07385 [Verrucomicrobiota bacterium]